MASPNPAPKQDSAGLGLRILRFIKQNGAQLLSELIQEFGGDIDTDQAVRSEVRQLVIDSLLAMKDSDIDHEWAYRLTRSGDRFVSSTTTIGGAQ